MKKGRQRDQIYDSPLGEIADFRFDVGVADVFADMINRSVPGYGALIGLVPILTDHFAQPDSRLYDLGCSLGAVSLAMRHGIRVEGCRIVAVDNSEAMTERCARNMARDNAATPVDIVCADIRAIHIRDASIVALNFTLQFLPPVDRLALLQTIYNGLRPGGALLLSEKLRTEDVRQEHLLTTLHHDFKRAMGYSDLAISQKRSALENVLIPDSLEQHRTRLQQAGFSTVVPWFQCLNFSSLLAVK